MELSIVVPLYNESESVEDLYRRIKSELQRLSLTYEIIFVDDGSTDETWGIIEKLKEKAPELKGIKFKHNSGQTSAMVAGFNYASGEIKIGFLLNHKIPSAIQQSSSRLMESKEYKKR